ncbi:MAG: hypothetical protein V4710_08745 [Verrucomicrobiota bacterium]
MNSTERILNFLTFLAEVRAMFRQVHLFAENNPALHAVSTMVIPFKGEPSDYADDGVTLSIALNAELRKPSGSEKKAIGMSILLRHAGGRWHAECGVGWTGEQVGWDPVDSKEVQAVSIDEISSQVPPLVEWAGIRFREELAKLPE